MRGICKRRGRRGFLLEQFLIPLMIAVILVPVMTSCIGLLAASMRFADELQDEIAVAQLRHVLIVSNDCEVSSEALYCTYHDEPVRVEKVNGFLCVRPGTWIFLTEITSASFSLENGCIVLYYSRNEDNYRRVLVHA